MEKEDFIEDCCSGGEIVNSARLKQKSGVYLNGGLNSGKVVGDRILVGQVDHRDVLNILSYS